MLAAILNCNKEEKTHFMVIFKAYFGLKPVSAKHLCVKHSFVCFLDLKFPV